LTVIIVGSLDDTVALRSELTSYESPLVYVAVIVAKPAPPTGISVGFTTKLTAPTIPGPAVMLLAGLAVLYAIAEPDPEEEKT
jgi:hypothetical protein